METDSEFSVMRSIPKLIHMSQRAELGGARVRLVLVLGYINFVSRPSAHFLRSRSKYCIQPQCKLPFSVLCVSEAES